MTMPRPSRTGRRAALPADGLQGVLVAIAEAGHGPRVTLGDITRALGPGGPSVAILAPALVALSPATAIFGVATVSGLAIALLAAQIMLDRQTLWLPGIVLRISLRRTHLDWMRRRLDGPLAWIERRTRPRLTALMRWPLGHVPGAATFGIGAALPFLELVPLSATTGGAAVTLMVLGLLLDDGLLVLAGLAAAVGVTILLGTLIGAAVF